MPSIDEIRQTAERISGNPQTGDIRTFINELLDALDEKEAQYGRIPVVEQREQQRLH